MASWISNSLTCCLPALAEPCVTLEVRSDSFRGEKAGRESSFWQLVSSAEENIPFLWSRRQSLDLPTLLWMLWDNLWRFMASYLAKKQEASL